MLSSRVNGIADFPHDYASISLGFEACDLVMAATRSDIASETLWKALELDARVLSPDEVRQWLRSLPIRGAVQAVWAADREGLLVDFECFVQFYDDLWRPAADDVWVVDESRRGVLQLRHEEWLMFYERRSG